MQRMNQNTNGSASNANANHTRRNSNPTRNDKAFTNRNESYQIVEDATAEMVKSRFLQFLCNYGRHDRNRQEEHNESEREESFNYRQQAQLMRSTETSSLYVDFAHILDFDSDLAHALYAQYYRWEPYLRRAVFEFIQMEDPSYTINDDANKTQREFFVCFYNFQHVFAIRDLRMQRIGELVSFSGTVTRTSEVRPELLYGAFTCNECGGDTVGIEQQFKYTEPIKCHNPFCTNVSGWEMNTAKSVFVDWQRVKVQENSDEIPAGSMPRSMDVILRHENVDQAKAGDRVVFTGTLIVVPDVSKLSRAGGENVIAEKSSKEENSTKGMEGEGVRGLKSLGVRELTYKTCFLACSVQTMEQRFNTISIRNEYGDEDENDAMNDFTEEEIAIIQSIRQDPDRYMKMAKSICPSVYGHDEIRKGILLMLFGGVHKKTEEGINLRGDINICIVGDPSTAKSQFLKYICTFLPRAIYTSGKVSSAAGLTASVTRDVDSGEYCVEAGALMLADNGICCIDEFDKMDTMDQVAIHEAMEQQTISITKAGIQATLNARTSILAAANPYNGRYDRTKTLKYNVNISAPIMSRFDLFFVVLDECEQIIDQRIAEHIVNTHMPPSLQVEASRASAYSENDLKRYIKYARTLNPTISKDAKQMMIACYKSLRENDVVSNGQANIAYRITVRQLESMIRLSEALARMDLSAIVLVEHVEEAYRLLSKSIIHVDTPNVSLDIPTIRTEDKPQDPNSGGGLEDKIDELSDRTHAVTIETDKAEDDESMTTVQSIPFKRFATIQKAIGMYIRSKMDETIVTRLGSSTDNEQDQQDLYATDVDRMDIGVMQGELVTWYLSSQDITSEAQLAREKTMIESVIDRLIRDKFLVVISTADECENAESESKDESDDILKQERYLAIHPNCAL